MSTSETHEMGKVKKSLILLIILAVIGLVIQAVRFVTKD